MTTKKETTRITVTCSHCGFEYEWVVEKGKEANPCCVVCLGDQKITLEAVELYFKAMHLP